MEQEEAHGRGAEEGVRSSCRLRVLFVCVCVCVCVCVW